jgi:hypothetical protein
VGQVVYGDTWDAIRSLRAWELKCLLMFNDTQKALRVREAAFGPSVLWKVKQNLLAFITISGKEPISQRFYLLIMCMFPKIRFCRHFLE